MVDRFPPVKPVTTPLPVVLRLYRDWPRNTSKYREVKAVMREDQFSLWGRLFSRSTVVALVPWDQQDSNTRAYVGHDLVTWLATGETDRGTSLKRPKSAPVEFALPASRLQASISDSMPVLDALGNPMPKSRVELLLSEDGYDNSPQLVIRYKGKGHLQTAPIFFPWGKFRNARIRVSHPGYGAAAPVELPPQMQVRLGRPQYVIVPLVSRKSPEYKRALHVTVRTPEGRPVKKAPVIWGGLYGFEGPFMGGGARSLSDPREPRLWTDRKGRFDLYPPLLDIHSPESEKQLLRGTGFQFRVVPPSSDGLIPMAFTKQTGSDHIVTLERGDRTYTVTVEDANRQLLADRNFPTRFVLHFYWPDGKRSVDLRLPDFRGGLALPQGTLKSEGYEPVATGPDAPANLVLRLIGVGATDAAGKAGVARTITGKVVSAVTGEAIPSGLALTMTAYAAGRDIADLTDAEWRQLHSLENPISIDDPQLEPLRRSVQFNNVQRCNKEGNFKFHPAAGNLPFAVVVLKEGYIPLEVRTEFPDEAKGSGRQLDLAEIRLLPAAAVSVTVKAPPEPPMLWVQWTIHPENRPPWASNMQGSIYQSFHYGAYPGANKRQRILVPAGLRLRLFLETPYSPEWGSLTLADDLLLQQGETRDLGSFSLQRALRAAVLVTDAEGKPLEGVPVSVHGGNGSSSMAVPSGIDGVAHVFVTPSTKGYFLIAAPPRTGDPLFLKEELPFEVGSSIPAGSAFKFQISVKLEKALFPERSEE